MDPRFYHRRNPLPCIWGVHPISAVDLFDIHSRLAAPRCALQRLPAVQRAAQVFEDRDLLPNLARKAGCQILHVVNCIQQDRVLKPLDVKGSDLADERQRVRPTVSSATCCSSPMTLPKPEQGNRSSMR